MQYNYLTFADTLQKYIMLNIYEKYINNWCGRVTFQNL